ncbi:hypothetical protein NPIL_435651 [Nephila pilipes]|uniref:Uncharacterized protein n=1 Tax=Nephila pilipes TaxID=299642 RepID=A0A8X6TLF9_NEPPI|nr:hypothetical protein NPIL_435651 [Nephila pilipes]
MLSLPQGYEKEWHGTKTHRGLTLSFLVEFPGVDASWFGELLLPMLATNTKIDLRAEGLESDVIAIRGQEDVMKAKKRLLKISDEKQLTGHTAEIKANPEQYKFLIGKNVASIKKVLHKT